MSTNSLDDRFNEPPPVAEKEPTREDILGTLQFTAPREVNTKQGPRLVSSAPANELVFALWRREKESLKADGYSLGEFRGQWQISKWEKLPEKIVVTRETAKALSRATDADINVPAPDGLAYLGYQRAGIAFAFERPGTLIGDEMGLGKTIQAIGVMNARPDIRRILIVCPASLKLNWKRELEKWLCRKRPIVIADAKVFTALADGIVIVNYDVLHRHETELRGTEWDLIICDEAHYLKNPKARRTKMVFGEPATAQEKKMGGADVPPLDAKVRLLLTGTPIANKPVELWPLIHYLDPITWRDFFRFALRYCAAHKEYVGRKSVWDFSGASNLDELQDKLRSTIMVRRLKKDVLTELPPKRRQVIELPCPDELADVFDEERRHYEGVDELEADVEIAAASDDPNAYELAVKKLHSGQQAAFTAMSSIRLETGLAMIPLAIDHLKEVMEEVGKVVVFGHHKEVLRKIHEAFPGSVMIVGDTPMAERQANADSFQNDPACPMIIGSFGAMGVGWTLTAAAHLVTVEQDWVPGNVYQAEDRIHRIGQKDSVLIQHLVIERSLGATIMKRIVSKQNVIDRALDVVTEKSPEKAREKADSTVLDALASRMTDDQSAAAAEAICRLADHCNGAKDWDGMGFSKIDVRVGHSLAQTARSVRGLSRRQAALAQKVSWKYRGQLPDGLVERLRFAEASK